MLCRDIIGIINGLTTDQKSTTPSCEIACRKIGRVLAISQSKIDEDLQQNTNHYLLLKDYLSRLKRKATTLPPHANEENSRQGDRGDNRSLMIMESDASNDANPCAELSDELLTIAKDEKEFQDFTDRLSQSLSFGILESLRILPLLPLSDHPTICNKINDKYHRPKDKPSYTEEIPPLIKQITSGIQTITTAEANQNATAVSKLATDITDLVKHLITVCNHANQQEELQLNCINYIKTYKPILNNILALLTLHSNNSDNMKNMLKSVCDAMEKSFLDYIESTLRYCFGFGLQENKPPQTTPLISAIWDLDNTDFKFRDEWLMFITKINKKNNKNKNTYEIKEYIENLDNLIQATENVLLHKGKQLADKLTNINYKTDVTVFLANLKATRNHILQEWSIHWTEGESHTGQYGYVNVGLYLHRRTKAVINEIKNVKNACNKELSRLLTTTCQENVDEIKKNSKNLKQKPFNWNQVFSSDSQDNQPHGQSKIRSAIITVKRTLNFTPNIPSTEENRAHTPSSTNDINSLLVPDKEEQNSNTILEKPIVNSIEQYSFIDRTKSVIQGYADQLLGVNALDESLDQVRGFFSIQMGRIQDIFHRNRAMVNFLSKESTLQKTGNSESNKHASFKEEIYQVIYVEKNAQLIKDTLKAFNGKFITFLNLLHRPKTTDIMLRVSSFLNQFNDDSFNDNSSSKTSKDYVDILMKIYINITALRHTNHYLDRLYAEKLEILCYKIVETHVLHKNDKLGLDFSEEQLFSVKSVIFAVQAKDNDRAKNLMTHLERKIQYRQRAPENVSQLLLGNTEQDSHDLSLHHLPSYSQQTNSAHNIHIFMQSFIKSMESHTIATYAINSGLLQTKPTAISKLSGVAAGIIGAVGLPGAAAVAIAGGAIDDHIQGVTANAIVQHTPDLFEWLRIISKELAPQLARMFRTQLVNMANDADVRRFATFCQMRMFSALKENPEWGKGLTLINEFLITAVFRQTDKLTSIPFREDHYDVKNNVLGEKATFQSMVASVGISTQTNCDLQQHRSTVSEKIVFLNPRVKRRNKDNKKEDEFKSNRLNIYGLIDVEPEFAKKLADRTNRNPYPYNNKNKYYDRFFPGNTNKPKQTLGGFLQQCDEQLQDTKYMTPSN